MIDSKKGFKRKINIQQKVLRRETSKSGIPL